MGPESSEDEFVSAELLSAPVSDECGSWEVFEGLSESVDDLVGLPAPSDGFEPWPAPAFSVFLWLGEVPPELPDADDDESVPSVVAPATAALPSRNALIPTAATPVPSQALTASFRGDVRRCVPAILSPPRRTPRGRQPPAHQPLLRH